jgi:hypothetical protein
VFPTGPQRLIKQHRLQCRSVAAIDNNIVLQNHAHHIIAARLNVGSRKVTFGVDDALLPADVNTCVGLLAMTAAWRHGGMAAVYGPFGDCRFCTFIRRSP